VNGIPVLINDQRSIFSIADFASPEKTFFGTEHESKLKKTLRPFIPAFGKNIKARANYRRMRDLLRAQSSSPRVLVLGGSILGQGMGALIDDGSIEMVDSDVSFGPRTRLICDAHDIPFQDGWFDGVIIQAVLGNVLDPFRCVGEIHRVLKKQGLVYAETPFMQQNFSGRFDFTRFTHLGHRRLFRHFEEIDSGAACGPGMALACSYGYFLMSFAPTQTAKSLAMVFARMTSFFLKYVDHYLIDKPGTIDAAAGFYFLGRRSEDVLPDRELIRLYRGAMDVR
jgi:SAM-dependent methyltransferase